MIDRNAPHLSNTKAHHSAHAITGRAREICMIASGPTLATMPAGILSLRGWVAKLTQGHSGGGTTWSPYSRLTPRVNVAASSLGAVCMLPVAPSKMHSTMRMKTTVSPTGKMRILTTLAKVCSDGLLDPASSSSSRATRICDSQTLAASPSTAAYAPVG